ncbi:hypothetical protein [Alteromonas gracilis]|uniref:hypothetical protein n=1 Tax=Alteromonas gracilis TaxID=1479524 RepID=UPI003736886E
MFSGVTGKVVHLQDKTVTSFSSTSRSSLSPSTNNLKASFSSYHDVSYASESFYRVFIRTNEGEETVTIPDSIDVREGHIITVLFDSGVPIWAFNETLQTRAFCFKPEHEGGESFWCNSNPPCLSPDGGIFASWFLLGVVLLAMSIVFALLEGPWYLMWMPVIPFLVYKNLQSRGFLGVTQMPCLNERQSFIQTKWRYKVVKPAVKPILTLGLACFSLVYLGYGDDIYSSKYGFFNYEEPLAGIVVGTMIYFFCGLTIVLWASKAAVSKLQPEFESDVRVYREVYLSAADAYLQNSKYKNSLTMDSNAESVAL